MTKEEAIKGLEVVKTYFSGYKPNEEMFDMAIKALKSFGCTGCEHYDQEETAMICKECRRYYKDKHSQYEPHKEDK